MTREDLTKAYYYRNQIDELKHFVHTCKNCWRILKLKNKRFKMLTDYGDLSDEIFDSKELATRILKVIEDYYSELDHKLDEMLGGKR